MVTVGSSCFLRITRYCIARFQTGQRQEERPKRRRPATLRLISTRMGGGEEWAVSRQSKVPYYCEKYSTT